MCSCLMRLNLTKLMKVCTRETTNGLQKYYMYMLVYVNDMLHINCKPDTVLTILDKIFHLKPDSLGKPDFSWD